MSGTRDLPNLFAAAFKHTVLAAGVFLGSSDRGDYLVGNVLGCEAQQNFQDNSGAESGNLKTPAELPLSDEACERAKLQSFIDIFNSMIPVGSYTGHSSSKLWEELRSELIGGVRSDPIDNLKRIKAQLVSETAPIFLHLSKEMLWGLEGTKVTEMPEISEVESTSGEDSQGNPSEITRTPLFIEINWHGIPYRARLNELMMVDAFVIDGVLVLLSEPLGVDTRGDLLGDLTDLVSRLRPDYCDLFEVRATSGVRLDFSWNGGRYRASALGILKFSDRDPSVLHPVSATGQVDDSIL